MNRNTIAAWPAQEPLDILRQAQRIMRFPDGAIKRELRRQLAAAYYEALKARGLEDAIRRR